MISLPAFLHQFGSSRYLYHISGKILPYSGVICAIFLGYGLIVGLFIAPPDYQQGDAYRIIFIHVPCAILSLSIYVGMAFCSVIYLIWRIKVADVIARTLAPIGLLFAFCALVTGSIWGKPMWGTWWIWDARLTSELILFFLYMGYLALYSALPNPQQAAKISAILACVGVVDIPIIHYSVVWWHTLHQGSTLSFQNSHIDPSMLKPLLAMIIGLGFYVLTSTLIGIRAEMLKRYAHCQWVKIMLLKSSEAA